VGRVLSARPIVYLGTISYGIYVVHLFAPWLWDRIGNRMGAPSFLLTSGIGRLPILFALTVSGAALSWQLMERPINSLKSRFPYPQERRSNGMR
jgi:peptidoglycan/LPS O-acetylase OafA/YrhL